MLELMMMVIEANMWLQEEEKGKLGLEKGKKEEEKKEKKCLGKKWSGSFLIYTEG